MCVGWGERAKPGTEGEETYTATTGEMLPEHYGAERKACKTGHQFPSDPGRGHQSGACWVVVGGVVMGVGQSSPRKGKRSPTPSPTLVLGHSPKALSLSLPRRCCCSLSVAPQGQEDPAQIASEDHRPQTSPGQRRGPPRLPEAPPRSPGARGARSPGGRDHQALAPDGRAGGGAGRAAGSGGSLPAWALPPHATLGLAACLARLAPGARGRDPALGGRPAPRPAGRAARALGVHGAPALPRAGRMGAPQAGAGVPDRTLSTAATARRQPGPDPPVRGTGFGRTAAPRPPTPAQGHRPGVRKTPREDELSERNPSVPLVASDRWRDGICAFWSLGVSLF